MKIAILDADYVASELVARHGDYPEMFQTLLRQVDASLEFQVFKVIAGEFPEHLDAFDGFLITGSQHSACDSFAWIGQLQQLVIRLRAEKRPLVGICFGHQLIAAALAGKVEKARQGWGVGVHSYALFGLPDDGLGTEPAPQRFSLLASHQDQVVTLPPAAQKLAGSDFCPNAMYRIGDSILTFQGHPEFTREYSRALLDRRRANLGEAVYRRAMDSLDQPVDSLLVAGWIVEFFRGLE